MTRGEKNYDDANKKFPVRATPTVVTIDNDGKKIGQFVGYRPPAEVYIKKLKTSLKSTDVFFSGTFDEAFKKSKSENKNLLLLMVPLPF